MKIAVPYDGGMIFPHFGCAKQWKIYEERDGEVISSELVSPEEDGHSGSLRLLRSCRVAVVLCGGISTGAKTLLAEAGIRLYGGCRGLADKAVESLLNHTLMYDPQVSCVSHVSGDCMCSHDGCSCCSCPDSADLQEDADMVSITLTVADENGNSEDCEFRVIGVYPVKAQRYIALTPDMDAPELEADIFLFRYLEEDGRYTVEEIMEDEEFAVAADAFQKWQLSRE